MQTSRSSKQSFPNIPRPVPDEVLTVHLLGVKYTQTDDGFKAEVVLAFQIAAGVVKPSQIGE
jgi:hypothetical protein